MDAESLSYLPLHRLAERLASRELSPVEVTGAVLARVERLNPRLGAFLAVTADEALDTARWAEREIGRGGYRGPLHGVPISLKDLYATRGVRTTAGSKILSDWVPDFDAAVVERLRAAGAILIGKTAMHEFALGPTTINPHFGTARNPWDLARTTSGSSGGSAAAVAAGLGYASMGSETGNSIRRPAAFCGVVGLKPTYGRVSRYGMVPAAWSLDHAGPFTRSVRDAALLLDAVASRDHRDPASLPDLAPVADAIDAPPRGLRVGIPARYLRRGVTPGHGIAPEVAAAFDRAIETLRGLGIEPIDLDLPAVRFTAVVSSTIMAAEAAAYHAPWLAGRPTDYGADVRARLDLGSALTAAEYLQAQRGRARIVAELDRALESVDAIVAPTAPRPTTRIDEGAAALGDLPNTVGDHFFNLLRLFSLAGMPVVSVPMGFSAEGLPLGLQVAARRRDDATALRVALAYEAATDWSRRRPSLD